MRLYGTISREQLLQLRRALQRWENEGGAGGRDLPSTAIRTGNSNDLNSNTTVRSSCCSPSAAQGNGSNE